GELAEVIKSQAADLDQKEKKRLELQDRIERNKKSLGWSYKVKKQDPKSEGWGVVFHRDEDHAVKEAIAPLIERRRKQLSAGSVRDNLHPFEQGDTVGRRLMRHGNVSHGNPDPRKVPYYPLVVGGPDKIPYSFGYLLDAEYAVGRPHFDTPQEYAEYARQ